MHNAESELGNGKASLRTTRAIVNPVASVLWTRSRRRRIGLRCHPLGLSTWVAVLPRRPEMAATVTARCGPGEQQVAERPATTTSVGQLTPREAASHRR